jgi:hypothetical protein
VQGFSESAREPLIAVEDDVQRNPFLQHQWSKKMLVEPEIMGNCPSS